MYVILCNYVHVYMYVLHVCMYVCVCLKTMNIFQINKENECLVFRPLFSLSGVPSQMCCV